MYLSTMNNAQNTPNTPNMTQVTFQAPKRVTRKAMQSAIQGFGNDWYCMTVNGQPAFFFPETNTAFIPGNAYYSDFHMHLRCAAMNQQVQETPQNWH